MNQPESATIWATMENSSHPEYGVAMIPFPIPRDSYDSYMEKLRLMEIGDPLKQDCRVVSVVSDYSVLKPLEIRTVNVDELDYLAKRLESFDVGEAAQFQAMAHKMELFELKHLINLTFCCQKATVITDFSDLEQAGREHYMNLHGGCAPTKELKQLNGVETAKQLIDSGKGIITPYGVVFDNGMKLEQHYDGNIMCACGIPWPPVRASGWCRKRTARKFGNCSGTMKFWTSSASTPWCKSIRRGSSSTNCSLETTICWNGSGRYPCKCP